LTKIFGLAVTSISLASVEALSAEEVGFIGASENISEF
jgi:hypothetical protein